MLVQQIMAGKPSVDVATIGPAASIHEAAEVLSKRKIGALIVSDSGTDVQGVISERDIVRELGRRGTGCLTDTVGSIMTRDIITTTGADTAENVLQTMTNGRFRHMPEMDGDTMIGVVSIGDIVSARLNEVSHEKDALQSMIMGH
ncbi:MAG: CBS domain-containing protein [Rhodobacteraceae bacterium]|nr:CBS domain-containing protein [Paracoccaceae bacterium]